MTGDQFAALLREVGVVHDGSGVVPAEVVDAVADYLAQEAHPDTVNAVSSGMHTAAGWVPSTYTRLISTMSQVDESQEEELACDVFPHGVRAAMTLRGGMTSAK
jgi:hypothetical protein